MRFSFSILRFLESLILSVFLLLNFGCNPTSQKLAELVGEESTKTKNGPIGNSALSFSPTSKDFGTLTANSGTSTQNFTVSNTTSYRLQLGTISGGTTQFSLNALTCTNGAVLNGYESCIISVTFTPTTSGQFSTSVSIPYTYDGSSYYSSVSVVGSGTTLSSFAGLDSLSNIGVTDMKLNWTDVAGADSYQVYKIQSGSAIYVNGVSSSTCIAGACAYTAGGLNPSTSYTFRVRAMDSNSVQEQNIVGRTATTNAGVLDLTSTAAISYAGDCAQFTITTKDSGNNPVNMTTTETSISITATGNGTIYTDSGCTTATNAAIIYNGNSSQNFYYKNTTAQSITFTAALTTYNSDTLTYSIGATVPAITYSTITTHPTSIVADNTNTISISATLRDQYNNICSGQSISLTSSRGATDTITTSPSTTNSSGVVSYTVKSATVGNPTLTFSSGSFSSTRKVKFLSHTPSIDFQAVYAKSGSSAGDSTVTSSWKDLFSSSTTEDLDILNFLNPNTSWNGNGGTTLSTDPYRLTFDSASSNYLEGTTVVNSSSDAYMEAWIRPSSVTTKKSVVMSNGNASNKGFVIRQSPSDSGVIELKLGSSNNYVDEVMSDAPISYWRFNEASGLTAFDSIGLANGTYTTAGVYYNQAPAISNSNNKAVGFDGTNGMVKFVGTTSDYSFIQNTAVFAVEMWLKTTDYTNATERLPIGNTSTGSRKGFYISYAGGGTKNYYALLTNGGGSFGTVTMPANSLLDNNWHHVVYTGDGTSTYLYLDSVLKASTSVAAINLSSGASFTQLAIGAEGDNFALYQWYGNIDDVAIYNTNLSAARILSHYNARTRPSCETASSLSNSIWNQVIGSYDSTNGYLKLFLNGTNECSVTLATPGLLYNGSTSPLSVGAHLSSSGGIPTAGTYWSGDIGEVRASNTLVTNSQAIDHYNASNSSYPSFLPTSITGLRLWFDATDSATLFQDDTCSTTPATTTGHVVGCWKDKSGNNLHATQTVAGTKPTLETSSINSKAGVRFGNATVRRLDTPTTNINERTYFIVYQIRGNAPAGYQNLIVQNASPYYQIYGTSGTTWSYYYLAAGYNSFISNGVATKLLTFSSGAYLSMRENSRTTVSNYALSTGALNAPFWIGAYSTTNGLNGDITELLVYDTQLSETNIKRIEAYLNAKYKVY